MEVWLDRSHNPFQDGNLSTVHLPTGTSIDSDSYDHNYSNCVQRITVLHKNKCTTVKWRIIFLYLCMFILVLAPKCTVSFVRLPVQLTHSSHLGVWGAGWVVRLQVPHSSIRLSESENISTFSSSPPLFSLSSQSWSAKVHRQKLLMLWWTSEKVEAEIDDAFDILWLCYTLKDTDCTKD